MNQMNQLYFGDWLEVLRDLSAQHKDGYIDLIYIDPPFNSQRNYNVLFESLKQKDATAQKQAFADTWSNVSYIDELSELSRISRDLYQVLEILSHVQNVSKSTLSYLTIMAHRIFYMHKLLKDTGSFYLHCDPNRNHYLKVIFEIIFNTNNFRNEIVWKRTSAKGLASRKHPSNQDVILSYHKSKDYKWNIPYLKLSDDYIKKFYRYVKPETGRRYKLTDLTNPNRKRPNLTYEFLGVKRVWRWTKERMQETYYKKGEIVQNKPGTVPRFNRHLDE